MDFDVYNDIEKRTNGEIYIGVVGPVRTGKSTFIKNFMDAVVIPNINDENEVKRTLDELPQSAAGKTIMTTEPKFVPEKGIKINIGNGTKLKVRLIDCVGFMVEGVNGHMEEDKERMVKTPWFDYEIPFSKAAETGTRKVISEHSTIGVVITCDGSFTDIDPKEYNKSLEKTVNELNKINKPYIILLNSLDPTSKECITLRDEIENKYNVATLPINCLKLNKDDVNNILENVLFEFPITKVIFDLPKWIQILEKSSPLMKFVIDKAYEILKSVNKIKDVKTLNLTWDEPNIKDIRISQIELAGGEVTASFQIDENYYYKVLSEITGINIDNQLSLIKTVKDLSKEKNNYSKVNDAIESVKESGYGIVTPGKDEVILENPELIKNGNKYGVKIKAMAPSIHFMKANILTEISPIIGTKEQAMDLIDFINSKDEEKDIWETNIFGKSIGEIVNDGITGKINNLTIETRDRMQGTIEKITNDQSKGVICILL